MKIMSNTGTVCLWNTMCSVYMVEWSKLGFSYELTSKRLPGLQIRKRSSEKKNFWELTSRDVFLEKNMFSSHSQYFRFLSQQQAWACRNSQPTTHSECRAFKRSITAVCAGLHLGLPPTNTKIWPKPVHYDWICVHPEHVLSKATLNNKTSEIRFVSFNGKRFVSVFNSFFTYCLHIVKRDRKSVV